MKWKAFSLILLIVGLMAVGSLTIAEEADTLDGNWTLNFFWGSNASSAGVEAVVPDSTTSLNINMFTASFGSFTTGDGGSGWVLNPASNPSVVLLIFTGGCRPIYISRDYNGRDFMSGTMKCRDPGGPAPGTWNAKKP